jgi:hypothetical protein
MEAHSLSRWGSLVCLISLLLAAPATMAGSIKCWTNKDGIRECGYSVPPEYSQQRIEIMNERGIVIEIKEAAKTEEQLAEEARLAKLKQEELRRQQQARLRDTVLLNTFTTERDLKISYDDKIAVIMGHIDITNTGTRSLNQHLKDAQRKAANYERAGEKLPESLLEEMKDIKRQIKDNDNFIARKMQEVKALNSQYEADLKRFRELRGISPNDTAKQ